MTVRPEDLKKKQEVYVVERINNVRKRKTGRVKRTTRRAAEILVDGETKARMFRYSNIQLKEEPEANAAGYPMMGAGPMDTGRPRRGRSPGTEGRPRIKAPIGEHKAKREPAPETRSQEFDGPLSGARVLYDGDKGQWGVIPRLGPDEAGKMLARLHPSQRKPSSKHIDQIVRAMMRGEYKWTGDPIRFDPEGQLLDGQHRLLAVTVSGVTLEDVPFAVLHDEDVMRFIDTVSKPRTVQQIMRTEGFGSVPNAVLAAVVYCENGFHEINLSRAEKVEVVRESDLLDPAATLYNTRAQGMPVTAGPLAGALACWRAAGDDAMDFFQATFKNQHMIYGEYSPNAALLATWLLQHKGDRSRRARWREGAEKAIRAWNAHREGRALTKLQSGHTKHMPDARE